MIWTGADAQICSIAEVRTVSRGYERPSPSLLPIPVDVASDPSTSQAPPVSSRYREGIADGNLFAQVGELFGDIGPDSDGLRSDNGW